MGTSGDEKCTRYSSEVMTHTKIRPVAKSKFPKTTLFSAATAILMQAEPKLARDTRRDAAAAAAMPDYVYLWKIDLQAAYRYWRNHPSEL